MLRYLVRRLLWAAVLFVAVTLVAYVLFFLIPNNPARLVAGQAATNAEVKRVEHFLGTDRPIYEYAKFLDRLVIHQNLGYSFRNRESVNSIVGNAAPVTASLVVGGAIFWMLLALPIGILSALRPKSLLDRASMLDTMNEDYVRTARTKGAPEWLVHRSHILRNALIPVVTMLGMDISFALGGAVFTETVYSLPGLGKTAIFGLTNNDIPIVEGVIVFATLAIIVFNLVVDLLYAWIDPRIRLTAAT